MQNNLFINRLIVKTLEGKTAYDQKFHRGVNIIYGQNSSGKSTIIRFIFFVLGGCYSEFVPEALKCSLVVAEVEINGRLLTLKRYLEKTDDGSRVNKYTPLYIYYGSLAEYLSDQRPKNEKWQKYGYKMSSERRSYSNVLFEIMGLPEFKADSNITMHQILRLIYLDQESPLSSLFLFEQFDQELTRVLVAELLMGLYDEQLSEAKLELADRNRRATEVKQLIKVTREFLTNPATQSPAFIETEIANLQKEIQDLNTQIRQLRNTELAADAKLPSRNAKLQFEYQRMQSKVAAIRSQLGKVEEEITDLKEDIKDSTFFISALQKKMDAVDKSIVTREYFDSLHLEFCPECLTRIDDTAEEGHCRLCKSPVDSTKGKSQAMRIKLELDFQIRESKALLKHSSEMLEEKESKRKQLKRDLASAQRQYDLAVSNVRSSQNEQIDELIQTIGYKEGEIIQFRTLLEYAEKYEGLLQEQTKLKERIDYLVRFITASINKAAAQRKVIEAAISENGVYLLQNDKDRQQEFRNARNFRMDFEQNMIYLTDQHIKLSASSAFYLKMAARFAFFLSSVQEDSMMYPRLILSDNMEDKGLEDNRSQNFQNILVRRLKQLAEQKKLQSPDHSQLEYQVIFATSMIAPELNTKEYTIGEYYTRENKSLKNV